MKFLHMADVHLDAPFVELGQAIGKAESRRRELKETFLKGLEVALNNSVDVILISGDLFEHKYVEKSTIRFINDKFREISPIKVFISPGNHDPFVQNSYYINYDWADNVFIFGGHFEMVSLPELNANIWGVGFNDFYVGKSLLEGIEEGEKEKINILITHGTVDIEPNGRYHPLSSKDLVEMRFDYCALGHIHKTIINEKNKIYNPGSPEPLGFDEPEEHGVLLVEVTKDYRNVQFVPIALRQYFTQDINIEGAGTVEEVIDRIKLAVNFETSKENLYKINLIGKFEEGFSIDNTVVEDGLKNYFYFIKIEDKTEVPYLLEELSKERTIKGLFVNKMLEMIEKATPQEKDGLEKALKYGLDALIKGEVKI